MSVLKYVTSKQTTTTSNNLCLCCSLLPLGGAKPAVRIIWILNSLPMFSWVSFHMLSNKHISLCPLSLQAKQQQLLRGGLGQDGRAVAEGKGSRGPKESSEDDAATVTQPYDREHTNVNRRRRHAPAGWNGPIGDKGGRCCTPPHTQLCPFVLLLHPDNPLPFLSPTSHQPHLRLDSSCFPFTSWYCSCSFHSGVTAHISPPHLSSSRRPIKCFITSPPATSRYGCIVFCTVRITLYTSCKTSVEWHKERRKKKTLEVYGSSYI